MDRNVIVISDEKNVIIFGVDNSSSVNIDSRSKNILVLGEGSTQGLEDVTVTAEAKCSVNCTESEKTFVLSLHYNRNNSFLFVNTVKIYLFRAKDSKIKLYPVCLGNISKDFTLDDMKKNLIKKRYKSFFC